MYIAALGRYGILVLNRGLYDPCLTRTHTTLGRGSTCRAVAAYCARCVLPREAVASRHGIIARPVPLQAVLRQCQ